MMKTIEEYNQRYIGDIHLTFEEWNKIETLRDKETWCENKNETPINNSKRELKVGDPVTFSVLTGKTKSVRSYFSRNNNSFHEKETYYNNIQGYIIKINKGKYWWKNSYNYDISSNLGIFNGVESVRFRKIEDLSDIEIPIEIKNLSTDRLLNAYKKHILPHSYNGNSDNYVVTINNINYSSKVIKAELNNREHIFSGEDKKIMKKYKK